MELLSNLSCCFDASKDIGETSIELVICNCPVSKRCCLKWETATYFSALIFSLADFLADAFGYVSFVKNMDNHEVVQTYITIWLSFLIVSGVIVLSEMALPIYSLIRLTGCGAGADKSDEEMDGFRKVAKYWGRTNNILVVFTEDGIIAMVRILIAFKSIEAIADLQTTTGLVTSAIAFVVTFLRHCLLMIQIAAKLSKNDVIFSKCPAWAPGYCTKGTFGLLFLFFFTLFLSSCSVALTGMSMAISAELIEIHYNDSTDFWLNITLLCMAAPAVFFISFFITVQTRW
ncbi:uncharacterized protein [Watersipora subatra]|uniref:uncharacterized protein n=1 Tax=Watersipora subatra TaxID=2589382 RepID=UPI00355C3BDD